MMKVIFLGTGTSQGVPMIGCKCEVCMSKDAHDKRLRSSVLVESGDTVIVIDSGPDFRYQMLRERVDYLDAILITHGHKDHVGGLDDVRAYNYILGRPVDVYGEERVLKILKKDFDYAFAPERYPGVPEIILHRIATDKFRIRQLEITPIRGYHYKLPVLGFRIGPFAYLTDMNRVDLEEQEKLKGVDTLVINALRREPHISHFTLSQALEVIGYVKPRQAYLTHVSHQMGLHKEINKELPANVAFAYDTLKIEINQAI